MTGLIMRYVLFKSLLGRGDEPLPKDFAETGSTGAEGEEKADGRGGKYES